MGVNEKSQARIYAAVLREAYLETSPHPEKFQSFFEKRAKRIQ
jgi:hypothetical protein